MIRQNRKDPVFDNEMEILKLAKDNIQDDSFKGNELLPEYQKLLANYEKLLMDSLKLLNISDSQGKALKQREDELHSILNNANQGFLTFGNSLKIDSLYSDECRRIFGRNLHGIHIVELLWRHELDHYENGLELLSQVFAEPNEEMKKLVLNKLPKVMTKGDQHIQLEFKLIRTEEPVVMVIMTDVTLQLQSQAKVEYLSYHDSLTLLFNRAYVETIIPDLLVEENMPISMIMADMNGLKLANDVFGHQTGDSLLIKAGTMIKESFGPEALTARWGGDEFLIILPRTDELACSHMVEQMRERCNLLEASPIRISFAMGTATLLNAGEPFVRLFELAEKQMYKNKLAESKDVRKNLIMNIKELMLVKGIEDADHIDRITVMAVDLFEMLGYEADSLQVSNLKMLIHLHDVGKVVIPEKILNKPGSLSEKEWEMMRTHSEIGYRMAVALGEPGLAEAILSMHERWDGLGYPYGLKEMQIPQPARFLSVIDAYDIMTHDQIYKKALSPEAALEEIKSLRGKQFDPQIVDLFLEYMHARL
ncbi:Cyclic di-GMP phosphodiesterase response regulator RpfG [compost metagenome]